MNVFNRTSRLTLPVSIKAEAQETGEIEGLASPFGGLPDAYGDIIVPGAFSRSLMEHSEAGTRPAALWCHDQKRPIGTWINISEETDGLHVIGKLNLDTTEGRDALAHVRGGSATGLSIGYLVPEGGAERRQDGGRNLVDVDLVEISLPPVPAARSAQARQVKSQEDLRDLLRAAGLANRASEKLARGGWPALVGEDETENENEIAELLREAAAQLRIEDEH